MGCGHGSSKALGQSQSSFLNNRHELMIIDHELKKNVRLEE